MNPFPIIALFLALGACAPDPILRATHNPAVGLPPATSRCAAPQRAERLTDQVLAMANAQRQAHGLRPLTRSARLDAAAQGHACDGASRGSYSHRGSDGSTLMTRLMRTGYRMSFAAENTAWGYDAPEHTMRGWMKSRGHRQNILDPRATEIGLGLADGARPHWVMILGSPR